MPFVVAKTPDLRKAEDEADRGLRRLHLLGRLREQISADPWDLRSDGAVAYCAMRFSSGSKGWSPTPADLDPQSNTTVRFRPR